MRPKFLKKSSNDSIKDRASKEQFRPQTSLARQFNLKPLKFNSPTPEYVAQKVLTTQSDIYNQSYVLNLTLNDIGLNIQKNDREGDKDCLQVQPILKKPEPESVGELDTKPGHSPHGAENKGNRFIMGRSVKQGLKQHDDRSRDEARSKRVRFKSRIEYLGENKSDSLY